MIDVIGFDADDTLWHNEYLYEEAQEKLAGLLARYADGGTVAACLYETEMRNLPHYGYGIKSFTLSMIETATNLSEGRVTADEVMQIVGFAREMLAADVELMGHAEEAVRALADSYDLMVITKGDLRDQQAKLRRSRLVDCFRYVEVVSEKTAAVYRELLARYGIAPARFLMVGNSLRSDILPVLAVGGRAVHVPHETLWAHEHVEADLAEYDGCYELEHLGLLPDLVRRLDGAVESE